MYTDSPYVEIPAELLNKYTLDGRIPILNCWMDGTKELLNPTWTPQYIKEFKDRFTPANIKSNLHGNEPYYGSSFYLLHAFERYNITDKKVAVIGSTTPWIEAILLNMNNKVTTVEYNTPESQTEINVVSYWDFEKTSEQYDCIVTYSSIEHSGLGRYGDPLDPDGDIKTMDAIHKNLVKDGLLIWGAPVGHDAVVWNIHRIYGKIRLPLMFDKFKQLEWIWYGKELLHSPLHINGPQPVIVLQK